MNKFIYSSCSLLLFCLGIFLVTMQVSTTAITPTFFRNLQIQHQKNIEHQKRVNLIHFFDRYHSVKPYPITAYINASEQYQVDYRLLPAISVIESDAGNHTCGDNWWGWQSCKDDNFGSVAEGIQYVTQELASGIHYRGKSIDQKLRAYNHNPSYAPEVEKLMKEIDAKPIR